MVEYAEGQIGMEEGDFSGGFGWRINGLRWSKI
jgi:hypothetical protein